MPKNNLPKSVLTEVVVHKEQDQTDQQYLKLLRKLEVIIAKIKERRAENNL